MRWADGAFGLLRWPNALLAAGGVVIGAWWVSGPPLGAPTWWTVGAAMGLTLLANAWNDACDADIDRIAHPERPIPSGRVDRRTAVIVALAGGAAGIIMSWIADPSLGILSIGVAVVMVVYSLRLKRRGLAGNLVVAVLASLPFLYGAWSAGRPDHVIPLLSLAIPLHFAREVAKDLEDVEGDRATRSTLPVALGAPAARKTVFGATVVFAIVVMLSAWRWPMLLVPGVLALLPAAVATARSIRGQHGGPALFKTAMVAALAGMVMVLVA